MIKCNSIIFVISVLVISVLTACSTNTVTTTVTGPSSVTTSTLTSTVTMTLPPTTQTSTTQLTLADQGFIKVDGKGYFSYQRIPYPINDAVTYQNVTFAPYITTGTAITTGPIAYHLVVNFSDGTSEQLEYVGLRPTNSSVIIDLTKHTNPAAGVMLSWQMDGKKSPIIYLLVSD